MPRFVILCHDHPFLHWDVLLEMENLCRTWRLLASPELDQPTWPAEPLPDHRLFYLDYEGPVSGNRGVVTQWDKGIFEWIQHEEAHCEFCLNGGKWQGAFRFVRSDDQRWTLERVTQ